MEYNTELTKKTVPKREDGQVGIRTTLNNMGFSDSQIGYDQTTGTVTLNGKNLMKPGYLDEDAGVSYARESDIQKSLVNLYQGTNNPVVRVSDAYSTAAGKYGLSADALTYGNGTVSIGGKPLDILYIDNEGKAWARQDAVANAVASYANTVGILSPTELAKQYENAYLSNAQTVVNRINRREDFSYDPESDPVFQAYRNQYLREGARASRGAVADYAALTGGFENSAAATAGAQARQYYAQKLTDTVPGLAKQAYERYMEKYQTDLSLLDRMINLYDTAYENAASANEALREGANLSANSNVKRDQTAWEKNWVEKFNQQEYGQTEQEMAQKSEKHLLEMDALTLSNQQKSIYQEYYQRLLEAELTGAQLDNQIKQSKL